MMTPEHNIYPKIYARTRYLLGPAAWNRVMENGVPDNPEQFNKFLSTLPVPEFLPELARFEWIMEQTRQDETSINLHLDTFELNPTLRVETSAFKLSPVLLADENTPIPYPKPDSGFVLIWKDLLTGDIKIKSATANDLLAIKMVAEELTPDQVSQMGDITTSKVYAILRQAVHEGFLIGPLSKIKRADNYATHHLSGKEYTTVHAFTLQWHITHACDLHCKHCYDRTKRGAPNLNQCCEILDNLAEFCQAKQVLGQVSFTGGNPFLYPHFEAVYQYAADLGFGTSLLANPVSREKLETIKQIQQPSYFQVSLEGLQAHNDTIRGKGNYCRVFEFLGLLRDTGITPAVQLTLTKDNINQVIPLAERLCGHTDMFTFNRLSPVGEGANLLLPDKKQYQDFLRQYIEASKHVSSINIKDNLINIIKDENGEPLFGGCTGFGCGAAFNFLALLPDGEVHACRKVPSQLGNIYETSLLDIYDSAPAAQYRNGTAACKDCKLRLVCSGCYAMTSGMGMDIFKDRDPFCFVADVRL